MLETLDRSRTDVVLIVDDVPDNLSLLHDALDEAGYTVLVATHGEAALQRASQMVPDIILLDAVMPGMDGFEVARCLKATAETSHIPIVFMTGLSETEHVVAAFQAGGVDYVVKPIRPREVMARIEAHMQSARQARQARNALDAFGHASMTVRVPDGRILWQTPLARKLMQAFFDVPETAAPAELADWLRLHAPRMAQAIDRGEAPPVPPAWVVNQGSRRLSFALHQPTGEDEWLLVMQESSDQAAMEALSQEFKLTTREGEVLYWVVKGKTNRDIGDILGSSPATVKKQLEHIFAKLGVETRTAAAGLAMSRVAQLKAR
ncbi:response regulator transcription factor [uncultured Aquabacterium sp.]|jgi:DNA-binding response OmpR family regulator/DNA-binding CsgD family transcriptional regulator|uniref:response regulator transcription factor n=1 Tax=uncultured Aquabacterium sp. TaxID=158753 RepID=UPI0026135193|nr:response regulator transcription factor [uncultured Aquabacterium sp.]